MSKRYPIVAVTGSSGAGTTTTREAFEKIFVANQIYACVIEGDSFHRFGRTEMYDQVEQYLDAGHYISHFGPEANHFEALEALFESYSCSGTGKSRLYLHTEEEALPYPGKCAGEFSDWEEIPSGTDMLFYEGLHGGLITDRYNIRQHVDLLVGVSPIANLEWIQKIHRDHQERGYSRAEIVETITRRMPDYANYITPQFDHTDINFQRIPIIDTSNPFKRQPIPSLNESFVIINIRNLDKFNLNLRELLDMIHGSFMSHPNHIVIPGNKMVLAMQMIMAPVIKRLVIESKFESQP